MHKRSSMVLFMCAVTLTVAVSLTNLANTFPPSDDASNSGGAVADEMLHLARELPGLSAKDQNTSMLQHEAWPLRVALYTGEGAAVHSVEAFRSILSCLPKMFEFTSVTKLSADALTRENFDVLIVGGGTLNVISNHHAALRIDFRSNIKNFLHQGGGYVGVCAGAYLSRAMKISGFRPYLLKLGKGIINDFQISPQFEVSGLPMVASELYNTPLFYMNGPILRLAEALPSVSNPVELGTVQANSQVRLFGVGKKDGRVMKFKRDVCVLGMNDFSNGKVVVSSGHPEITLEGPVHKLLRVPSSCGSNYANLVLNLVLIAGKRTVDLAASRAITIYNN